MRSGVAEEPKKTFGERARETYYSVFGERPAIIWWLVSPTLIGVALDLYLRHGTLRYFPPRQWLNFFGSSLVAAGFWGSTIWLMAVLHHRGSKLGRVAIGLYVALFVLPFSFFAYGGQAVYFRVFNTYVARDTIRLGLELRGTVAAWMAEWGGKFVPAAIGALAITGLVVQVIRKAGRALSTAVPLVPTVSFVGSVFALSMDYVETKTLQAAPPDSCFLHGVAGLIHEKLTQKGPTRGMSIRTPLPLPEIPQKAARPNVILVITESVRADAICSKSSPRCRARFLDEVAPERFGLTRMTTQASGTFSACMTLWTGLAPDADFKTVHEAPFLWEVAKKVGYDTGYFSAQNLRYRDMAVYLKVSGIDEMTSAVELGDTRDAHIGAPDERATAKLVEWAAARKEPYLAVLHLSNTHWPYRVDPALQPFEPHDADPLKRDVSLLRNHYKNSVLMQERTVAEWLRDMKKLPSWQDTVVLFVSDHGEQFREHGGLYHLNNLFEEEVRIPGFVVAGERALSDDQRDALTRFEERRVYGEDVNATVLDLVGAFEARPRFPHGDKLTGRSLIRRPMVVIGGNEHIVAASTSSGVWLDNDAVYGVISGDRKVVGTDATPWVCYDLATDTYERSPLPPAQCQRLFTVAAKRFPRVPMPK